MEANSLLSMSDIIKLDDMVNLRDVLSFYEYRDDIGKKNYVTSIYYLYMVPIGAIHI
jgi:hypothetical protein